MKERTVTKKDIPLIMLSLMLALLMSSLDSTIVATALPMIATDLGGLAHYAWPVTAYMLASTISLLIFGKMSDIYGRRTIFMIGIVMFVATSLLCGMANTMDELIIYRGLQGVGGGIVTSMAFIIVGDLFTSRERGKYMGILASMFALASVIGPYLGGFITDNLTWRWVFYVNVPLGLLAIACIALRLPNLKPENVKPHIDYRGIALATVGVVPLLLAISWGGSELVWDSIELWAMVSVSVVAMVLFVHMERRAIEPVMPLRLFKVPTFNIATLGSAIGSFVMMAAIMGITLYAQGVKGMSATMSGQILTPAVLCLALTAIITGRIVTRTGKYRIYGLLGFIVGAIGCWLLTLITVDTTTTELYLYSAVFGIGLGFTMPVFGIAVQNAFNPEERATATASNQFLRNVGGTLGLAVFNNLVTLALVGGFHPATLVDSLREAFWLCAIVCVIGLAVTVFLKEVPLKTHDALLEITKAE